MTPSIPLKAVTREVVDAIHTRTTVLTGVIDTVINVCKGKTTKFIFLQNWTTNKRDTSNSLNYYNKKQANGLKKNVQFTKGEVQDLITVFSKLAEADKRAIPINVIIWGLGRLFFLGGGGGVGVGWHSGGGAG